MDKTLQIVLFIVIVIALGFLFYLYVKHTIKHRTETITCYTGGLGSGKTLLSVDKALKIYRKQVRKYKINVLKHKIYNFIRFKKKVYNDVKPLLFSNIPLKINKKTYAYQLTIEHLLLQEKLPLRCVILIDEIGAFASQFDYKEENVINVFDEFCRFYRHYTKGGYIIANDQCSENVNLTIRRRLNKIHNLSNCFVLWRFCWYYERMINISEEIKTIDDVSTEDKDTQDNMTLRFKFLWNKNNYDTYCYSERYNSVPQCDYVKYNGLKSFYLMKCPRDKQKKYVAKTSNEERGK